MERLMSLDQELKKRIFIHFQSILSEFKRTYWYLYYKFMKKSWKIVYQEMIDDVVTKNKRSMLT